MNNKTKTLIREIQLKAKSYMTGQNEFPNEDAVIDYAIKTLYDSLKKLKIL